IFSSSGDRTGRSANPCDVSWRSPALSRSQIEACLTPTLVIRYSPSGVTAVPSSSVGPKVICSAEPSGKACLQRWYPPLALEEKYIQRPSGDQAAVVH